MKLNVTRQGLEQVDAPIIVLGFCEDTINDLFDELIRGIIENVVKLGDFKGEKNESRLLYPSTLISKRLMLVGLGKENELDLEALRKIAGNISRKVRDLDVKHMAVGLPYFTRGSLNMGDVAEGLVQSTIMGSYNESYYKTKNLEKFKQVEELTLFGPEIDEAALLVRANNGKIIGEAVNYCRKLAWGPGNLVTPLVLAEEAEKIGEDYGIKVSVFGRIQAYEVGLHSFLAVARGTDTPPKFIIAEYGADKKGVDTVAIIGKGITFDTGGISLKSRDGMPLMKADMTGGAIVLATLKAVAQLGLDLHLICIVPATDNMPDGKAYHPGDVVKSYSGQTIEVISTDAEGRMILNDALSYAEKNYKPKAMIDLATLTGSMYTSVGDHALGYFSNSDWVADKLEEASKISGERVWRMPLWDVYDEQLKSDVADFKHTGGRGGGAITAARFLSKFVMDTPWAHLDIAGHSEQKSDKDYNPKGSKGPAVRLIVDLLRNWR
jgi:leucyl aminopeptidase